MSLILSFPSLEKAKEFALVMRNVHGAGYGPAIFTDSDLAHLYDPHPFEYAMPAVIVERFFEDFETEQKTIAVAESLGGVFVGT